MPSGEYFHPKEQNEVSSSVFNKQIEINICGIPVSAAQKKVVQEKVLPA